MRRRRALAGALLVGGYLMAIAGVAVAGVLVGGPMAGGAIALVGIGAALLTLGWFAYEALP